MQETILRLALANVETPPPDAADKDDWVHVHHAEVMAKHYGFTPAVGKSPGHRWYGRLPDLRGNGHIFSRKAIGEKRYNAACVAVTRAFKRLTERGLVERYCWAITERAFGAKLTEAGIEVARMLTVKHAGNSRSLNR